MKYMSPTTTPMASNPNAASIARTSSLNSSFERRPRPEPIAVPSFAVQHRERRLADASQPDELSPSAAGGVRDSSAAHRLFGRAGAAAVHPQHGTAVAELVRPPGIDAVGWDRGGRVGHGLCAGGAGGRQPPAGGRFVHG